jgi:hypothetical protein
VSSKRYADPLAGSPPRPGRGAKEVPAEPGLVVEDASGWVGEVVGLERDGMLLEDRHGRRRLFGFGPGYLVDGRPVRLVPPPARGPRAPARTRSGSLAVPGAPARVARAARILVEGTHDAELVERVWGDDLRIEGVVVEPLHGVDDLAAVVATFCPGPGRRLGVLVDHLVPGSKEARIVSAVTSPDVLVTGHPYVDIWQAVKPAAVGIPAWPVVPPGRPWKEGVCAALGVADVRAMWVRVLRSVRHYGDLEPALLAAVEQLIDFVTTDPGAAG